MRTTAKVKIEGLRELEHALRELPKATAKNVLKRILVRHADPVADTMRGLAPDDPTSQGQDLKGSIAVGTKLGTRQARLHKRQANKEGGRDFAEVFIGPGVLPQAHMQEWGTIHHGPQPFARPAWDQHQGSMLEGFKRDLWTEVDKAAQRLARKAMRKK